MAGGQARERTMAVISELTAELRASEGAAGITEKQRGRYVRWREHAAALEEYVRQHPLDPDATAVDALDTSDLPPELLKQLSGGQSDKLDSQIITVLKACNGSADLDQMLIGLFRRFGIIQKRRFLQNKLWRMVRKGQIHRTENARGIFCLDAAKVRKPQTKRES